jgi:hypothetical protein
VVKMHGWGGVLSARVSPFGSKSRKKWAQI